MNSLNANLHFDLFGCPAASKPFYQERLKKLFNFSHSSDDDDFHDGDNNFGDDHDDDDDDDFDDDGPLLVLAEMRSLVTRWAETQRVTTYFVYVNLFGVYFVTRFHNQI